MLNLKILTPFEIDSLLGSSRLRTQSKTTKYQSTYKLFSRRLFHLLVTCRNLAHYGVYWIVFLTWLNSGAILTLKRQVWNVRLQVLVTSQFFLAILKVQKSLFRLTARSRYSLATVHLILQELWNMEETCAKNMVKKKKMLARFLYWLKGFHSY